MKTLYTKLFFTLLVLFTFILLASSCSKKSDPDPLDQYVGTWDESTFNGQAGTNTEITIRKSANGLTISNLTDTDFTAKLSSSGFEADDKNINTGIVNQFPDNSKGYLYLQNLTGNVTGNKLTFKYTVFAQGANGYYKLAATHVFTKK